MYKAYKFRMYPKEKQQILLTKTFGCVRFVYNHFLEKSKNKKYTNAFTMCKELKELQKEYPFLKEVDSCGLRCAIFNLEDAYKDFFQKRNNYPAYKNKHSKQSYRTNCIKSSYKGQEYSNIFLDLAKKEIKLPKLGKVKIRGYRNLTTINGKIINATITKETTGKYYVSIIVEETKEVKKKVTPTSIVGIDLGIHSLMVTSEGKVYDNPKELSKYESKIKRLQRKLARQEKGSRNREKTKEKLSRIYSKIRNARRNNQIKIVNELVKENDIIVSENLKVKEMTKNSHLAKLLLDASFSKICEYLKWKCENLGKYYYQVNTYYPSSQICNHCGSKNAITKDLGVREWECKRCGSKLERDVNASINIMYEGIKIHYGKVMN